MLNPKNKSKRGLKTSPCKYDVGELHFVAFCDSERSFIIKPTPTPNPKVAYEIYMKIIGKMSDMPKDEKSRRNIDKYTSVVWYTDKNHLVMKHKYAN